MVTAHARAERHRMNRAGWLRAAVLGANDGLISTASLLVGIIASNAARSTVVATGLAALAAGALAMAAGEYVSVSAQSDAQAADIAKETAELESEPDHELRELAAIYRTRGLSAELASQVAVAMHDHDALAAHLRDELSITDATAAKPIEAALSSAAAFGVGALIAVLAAVIPPHNAALVVVVVVTVLALSALGYSGARLGGAKPTRPIVRVVVGGLLAMSITAVIGQLVGAAV
jgi:vacuolar iron transporter family protein